VSRRTQLPALPPLMALAALAALAALLAPGAGCGTLDAPELEPLVDPGKGPFRDQGAVEVCLGKTRIVSRKQGAALVGLCVGEGAQERACAADDACLRGESCICGRCILEGCSSAQPCSQGRLCRDGRCATPCLEQADCDASEICSSGGCTLACTSDDGCGYGGKCDSLSNTCVGLGCSDDKACGAGRVCALEERAAEVREPAWAALGSGLALYVELREQAGKGAVARSIYRGSLEGAARVRLADPPVVPPSPGAGAPSPLVRDGRLAALFAAAPDGSIVRYLPDDPDGRSFSAPPEPTLSPRFPWEAGQVGSPSVVAFRGADRLFYEGGTRAGIGHCTLDDAGRAYGCSPSPALTPAGATDAPLLRDVTEVGAPSAVVGPAGDVLLIHFTVRGAEGSSALQGPNELPAPTNDSVGLLATRDLARFDLAPQGPVFARRTNLRTYLGEREQAVLLFPGGASMIYVASDAAGTLAGLALAASP
jgi:hypothetical protein